MVKNMEEVAVESDRIVQACRKEMNQNGFELKKLNTKLDLTYVGIHSELRRMKTLLSAKDNLTPAEEQFYYKLSEILCYSDKAAREIKRSINRKYGKTMSHWVTQLNRLYAEKLIRLKDKLPFPPIFSQKFRESGLFVDYHARESGELPHFYKLCRKFETTLKRAVPRNRPRYQMMQAIPPHLQVEMKCFISVLLDHNNAPQEYQLFDKDNKPVISFHSNDRGKICLGSMRNFTNEIKGAVDSQRWDKINGIFDEIQNMFMTVNVGGEYGNYGSLSRATTPLHKKIFKLKRYLRGYVDENGNQTETGRVLEQNASNEESGDDEESDDDEENEEEE